MTSVSRPLSRICWSRARPSRSPGMRRSVTTTSMSPLVPREESAWVPESATLTSCPCRFRQIAKNSRIERSSSTTSTFPTRESIRQGGRDQVMGVGTYFGLQVRVWVLPCSERNDLGLSEANAVEIVGDRLRLQLLQCLYAGERAGL